MQSESVSACRQPEERCLRRGTAYTARGDMREDASHRASGGLRGVGRKESSRRTRERWAAKSHPSSTAQNFE